VRWTWFSSRLCSILVFVCPFQRHHFISPSCGRPIAASLVEVAFSPPCQRATTLHMCSSRPLMSPISVGVPRQSHARVSHPPQKSCLSTNQRMETPPHLYILSTSTHPPPLIGQNLMTTHWKKKRSWHDPAHWAHARHVPRSPFGEVFHVAGLTVMTSVGSS
jgi:hypothetical protein